MSPGTSDLTPAQAACATLLGALGGADWDATSPCPGWSVADVARHLVVGERAFATTLGGTAYDLPAIDAAVRTLEVEALAEAYADAAAAVRDGVAAAPPGAALPSGVGTLSPMAVAGIRLVEALVHGWDVAQATGRALVVDDGVATRALAAAAELRASVPEPERRFGVPQPIGADAAPLDRLAALMGRPAGGAQEPVER